MSDYTLIIIVTLFGFIGLAFLLLFPVYRFLKREEEVGKNWTEEHADRPAKRVPPDVSPNGASSDGEAS